MPANFLILGKDGQVGRALVALLDERAIAAGRKEVDLSGSDFISNMERFIGNAKIDVIINAAAYTQVDKVEKEGGEEAVRVNATAVSELAAWCKAKNILLVHYSTDYVFPGSGETPWRETDSTSPINTYGKSKQAGEQAIISSGVKFLLLRTSWVYDAYGKNFFNTIRRLLYEKEKLSVVSDQIGAPTYAPHLAKATLALLSAPSGIYHVCNSGMASWYDFAKAIFAHEAGKPGIICKEILPIPTSAYPLPAPRPHNSRLNCSKAAALGVTLPSWEEGLKDCFKLPS